MNNALVIKNASFSTNKVATVTFVRPCAGIEFDESSVTLNSLGTATIGYTTTPNYTTDTITITSSDITVISASGTTLTVNGIGTATLTITCGEYSDTCEVTVDIYEAPIYAIGSLSIQTAETLQQDHSGVMLRGNSLSKLSCAGAYADAYFEYQLPYELVDYGFDVGELAAIKIPNNTDKIHIHCEGLSTTDTLVLFLDGNNRYYYNNRYYLPVLSIVSLPKTSTHGLNILDSDVEVPAGCDAYGILFTVGNAIPDTITTESALETYVNTNLKTSIHYLQDT